MTRIWLPWLTMLVGVLSIAFSRRLGRDAVKKRMWTRFVPPEVMIVPGRRKLEEDLYSSMFSAFGVLLVLMSLWILASAYSGSN
jgi:hypothetical protein